MIVKIKELITKYSFLCNLLFAILTEIAFAEYFNYQYDFVITCFFFVFLYLYKKTDSKYSKKIKKYSMILSIVISLILSIGKIPSNHIWDIPFTIFGIKNIIKTLILFIGITPLLFRLFCSMFKNLNRIKLFDEKRKMNKKSFFIIFFLMLLSWIPFLLRYFPARMTPDSFYVIHYANEGILSDLHTFGHTWFFGMFFHLGKLIFGNLNIAVAFGTLGQMVTLSLIFTNVIRVLHNAGVKKIILIALFVFYALTPLNGMYSVTLWRDVLFGAAFPLLAVYLYEYINNEYKLSWKQVLLVLLSILFILFFRNNGIYVFILTIILIPFFNKHHKKIIFISGILITILYFVIKGPIFDAFGVAKTKSIEAYSIPLQQISRVIYLDGNISKKQREELNKYIKVDSIKESYRQVISDPIKNISNGDVISDNLGDFLSLWFRLLLKNPRIYVESYIMQTIGYWYPTIDYGGNETHLQSFFEEDVTSSPITGDKINNIIDKYTSKTMPFSNIFWSIGTSFILLIISTAIMLYNGNKKYLILNIPLYALWAVIMISTPVFAELRYIYGLLITIPILLITQTNNTKRSNIKT